MLRNNGIRTLVSLDKKGLIDITKLGTVSEKTLRAAKLSSISII
jgi:hypothetical protein